MSILIDENTTFIIQGITGREAVNMTRECLDYGSKVVGGVTPGPRRARRLRRAGLRHRPRDHLEGARRRLRAHRPARLRPRRRVRGARERHQAARHRHGARAPRRGRADRRVRGDEGRADHRAELPRHHLAGEVEDGRHRRAGGEHEPGVPARATSVLCRAAAAWRPRSRTR